jgi:nicotinamidase-related amidase
MLNIEDSLLIIVDAQGNLARVVAESEAAISRIQILTRAAAILGLPVLLTAQSPHKIGHTIAEIASLLPEQPELARTSFSVLADESCRLVLKASGRRQLLLCGFETHICVYQSAAEMLAEGCEVYVIADAVSSRQQSDKTNCPARDFQAWRARALDRNGALFAPAPSRRPAVQSHLHADQVNPACGSRNPICLLLIKTAPVRTAKRLFFLWLPLVTVARTAVALALPLCFQDVKSSYMVLIVFLFL